MAFMKENQMSKLFQLALEHRIGTMQRVEQEPRNGLWFRHESPYELTELRPLTYAELTEVRTDYDVKARQATEDEYRKLIPQNEQTSFLYATIVGQNKMETPQSYPGFTYYFQMTAQEIARCLFGIVDRKEWMPMTVGRKGLVEAQSLWKRHEYEFRAYEERVLGMVDPRVEVIIPFAVDPVLYFPQEEDR